MTRLICCGFILFVAAFGCKKKDIGGIEPGTVFVSASSVRASAFIQE